MRKNNHTNGKNQMLPLLFRHANCSGSNFNRQIRYIIFLREKTSSGNGSQFIVKQLLLTQLCLNQMLPLLFRHANCSRSNFNRQIRYIIFLREKTSSGNGSQFIVKQLLSTQLCLNHGRSGDTK
jgi:hypothetical protein